MIWLTSQPQFPFQIVIQRILEQKIEDYVCKEYNIMPHYWKCAINDSYYHYHPFHEKSMVHKPL